MAGQATPQVLGAKVVASPPAAVATKAAVGTASVVPSPWFDLVGEVGPAYAWPITVLLLCLFFRGRVEAMLCDLGAFIRRLRKVGWGNWYAESGEVAARPQRRLQREPPRSVPRSPKPERNC